jgi:hypothetical protein
MRENLRILVCCTVLAVSSTAFAGTVHTEVDPDPNNACKIANDKASARANRKGTCVTTGCEPTKQCTKQADGKYSCFAVSANHKGSCNHYPKTYQFQVPIVTW